MQPQKHPLIRNSRTLIVLSLCAAGIILMTLDGSPVTITWETASEINTAGFYLYRAAYPGEDFVRANDQLIPAQGSELVGTTYHYHDHAVQPLRKYVYRIEEIEWDGTVNLYPETVIVRAGLSAVWNKLEGGLLILTAAVLVWRGWLVR